TLECVEIDTTALVALETADVAGPDPEHCERLLSAGVDVTACDHRHRRQPCEPVSLGVHAVLLAVPAPRSCEGREVRHRCSGREDAGPVRWQLEELLQPLDGDALELRAQLRGCPEARALRERRGEPVCRETGRRLDADAD